MDGITPHCLNYTRKISLVRSTQLVVTIYQYKLLETQESSSTFPWLCKCSCWIVSQCCMRIWLRVVQCLFYRDWGKQVCLSYEFNPRMWIYTKVTITNLWPFPGHLGPMETNEQWRQRIVIWLKILTGRSQNGWLFSSLADRGVEHGTFGNNTSKWS